MKHYLNVSGEELCCRLGQVANGKWQMASGKWQVANGKWQMASGEWRVASGPFLLYGLRRKDKGGG